MRTLDVALLAAAVGLSNCAGSGAAPVAGATTHEIGMRAATFTPRELTVQVGDTVVWHNVDIVKHNALRAELFDTGKLEPGEKYSWTPSDTGTYRYQCTIHQRMRGQIAVVRKR